MYSYVCVCVGGGGGGGGVSTEIFVTYLKLDVMFC